MTLDKELIDKLLEGYQKPEDLIGENGGTSALKGQDYPTLESVHVRFGRIDHATEFPKETP